MADTEKLRDMLDNIIDKKPEQAQVDFHSYLQAKMQDVINDEKSTTSDNVDTD